MASSEPLTATAAAIERAFRIPSRTIRRWGKDGAVPKPSRGQYEVAAVLARSQRRADSPRAD